jgi:hypothetical protein
MLSVSYRELFCIHVGTEASVDLLSAAFPSQRPADGSYAVWRMAVDSRESRTSFGDDNIYREHPQTARAAFRWAEDRLIGGGTEDAGYDPEAHVCRP